MSDTTGTTSALDEMRKISKTGAEFWMGRDLQVLLGYAEWDKFEKVIEKGIVSCERAGAKVENHFRRLAEKVLLGSGAEGKRGNYFLSRYGCYLVAMNGDPSKEQIALAQTYFAVQTRRQEAADQDSAAGRRIELRERLTDATKGLNAAAKKSGVQKYGVFHDAGYKGLYGGMGLASIKSKKGLAENEDLFDRAGASELAANIFKAEQAKERLARLGNGGDEAAKAAHKKAGEEVRATIKRLGNTMPEDLPPEKPIRLLKKEMKRAPSTGGTDSLL